MNTPLRMLNILSFVTLLVATSCQTLGELTFEKLEPGSLTFPKSIKRVAIINNGVDQPDNFASAHLVLPFRAAPKFTAISATGTTQLATQELANQLASQHYFDQVVICDSALRTDQDFFDDTPLTQDQVKNLCAELDADMLISLELLGITTKRTTLYFKSDEMFRGSMESTIYPIFRVYLPSRSTPLKTLSYKDSIYWEQWTYSKEGADYKLISNEKALLESAQFSASLPLNDLLPHWVEVKRHYYINGNAEFRDATILVKKNQWEEAALYWKQVLSESKNKKKRQHATFNLALYHEMREEYEAAINYLTPLVETLEKTPQVAELSNIPLQSLLKKENLKGTQKEYVLAAEYLQIVTDRSINFQKLKLQLE